MNMGCDDLIYAEKNLLILNIAQFQVKKRCVHWKKAISSSVWRMCDDLSPLVFTKQMC